LSVLAWEDAYKLLIGSIVPRPIGWVSTVSAAGIRNIAPFSFFNGFGANPVILGFSPMSTSELPQKDTLANIRAVGEFVINIATEETLVQMDTTGRMYPPEIDEFEVAGLTSAPSRIVKPPRILESPINFECDVFRLVPLGEGEGSATLVLGRAVYVHVSDRVMRDGKIDPALLRPVARMGGPFYARPEILPYRRSDRAE
jgi:flavin reductase (DIM6/NTAB) family NADH-FMN oxidoreductase RutF